MRDIVRGQNKLICSVHVTYYLALRELEICQHGDFIYTAGHSYHDYSLAECPGTIMQTTDSTRVG